MGGGTTNFTSISIAGPAQKKVQTTEDILKQIESTITKSGQDDKYQQEELSARLRGRIDQHEAAYGDKALPRQRLPRMDPMLLDRYNAARRNILVLGAIKQASGPVTRRSNKSIAASSRSADHNSTDAASNLGTEPSTEPLDPELNSKHSSFNSRSGSSTCLPPKDGDLESEPSGLAPEASQSSLPSQGTRRTQRQLSNRSQSSSFAGSASGSKLRHVGSTLSTGSGHTLQSEATSNTSSKYSQYSKGYGRKTPRKGRAGKPRPGRVTAAMAEYAQKDDWMSKTLLKHYLASIIQARWRGYIVRKRWQEQEARLQLVEEVKAKNQADELHQQRLRDMQQKLLARQAKQQEQATAAAVAAASGDGAGSSTAAPSPTVKGPGATSRAVSGKRTVPPSAAASFAGNKSKAWQSVKIDGQSEACSVFDWNASDSDSGWSDIELEDVASIKFRAVTPPWQKVGQQPAMSQRLKRRTAAAAAAATGEQLPDGWSIADDFAGLGLTWDNANSTECNTRLQELQRRRICRKPEPVELSPSAVAAAKAAGLLEPTSPGVESADAVDANACLPLPTQAVDEILLDRYSKKYKRMGVMEKMPGRHRWLKLQQERQQRGLDREAESAEDVNRTATAGAALPGGPVVDGNSGLGQINRQHAVNEGTELAVSSGAVPALLPPVKGVL